MNNEDIKIILEHKPQMFNDLVDMYLDFAENDLELRESLASLDKMKMFEGLEFTDKLFLVLFLKRNIKIEITD